MSAPIQASASVQVVPASNCVKSRTRMPARQPGDTGVTAIVDSYRGEARSIRGRCMMRQRRKDGNRNLGPRLSAAFPMLPTQTVAASITLDSPDYHIEGRPNHGCDAPPD